MAFLPFQVRKIQDPKSKRSSRGCWDDDRRSNPNLGPQLWAQVSECSKLGPLNIQSGKMHADGYSVAATTVSGSEYTNCPNKKANFYVSNILFIFKRTFDHGQVLVNLFGGIDNPPFKIYGLEDSGKKCRIFLPAFGFYHPLRIFDISCCEY